MPLQIPVTQTGLEASIQQAMKNAGRNAQINLGTNSRQINALAQPLGRITGQADEFTKSMEAANARVFAFGASVGIINGVSKAFGALVKNTIEVEKSLVEINTVLNTSGDSLQKFGNKLFDVAKNTGQTFDVVAKGALELARQGLSTEETLKRINDALILSRLSGLDAQQSVEGLTAAFNSFKETGITTSQILNKLVVVSQKYSVSERDLIEGLKRSASVADQAGVSFDELVGIITTVQERTARGGAVIGNAFKTIFARIQDTGALQDLANLGIQVTDLEGKILPATKILQNLGAEFNNLSQLEQADIAKKLGGVYQLSNLLAAVKDLSSEQSKYNNIVKLSASATNEAYQKNAAQNATLDSLINKVTLSAQQLGATLGAIGATDSLKSLLSFFNNILEGIQKILGEESALGTFVQGLAKGIGNVLAGPGLMLFGAIIAKLSKDLISFGLESLKSFFKIGQSAKEIASVEKSIAAALGSNLTLQRQLFALEGNRAAQIKLMTDAIVQQEAVMRRMASTAGSLAGPLYQQGVRSTGGQGLRVPKAAGGYMPAVSQESRDISRGVGGAKAGDKPVVIPNFAFGGGKRGTMVAHTGEFIVPNFAAGGSAIFNRDMVRSMGLPAGAQKINAAGGFVPNFASKITYGGKTYDTATNETFKKYAADYEGKQEGLNAGIGFQSLAKYNIGNPNPDKGFYVFPDGSAQYGSRIMQGLTRPTSQATVKKQKAQAKEEQFGSFTLDANQLGGILVVSPRFGAEGIGSLNAKLQAHEIPFFNYSSAPPIDKNKFIKLNNLKTSNTPKPQNVKGLQGDISQLFAGGVVDLAYRLYGGTFDPASAGEFSQKLKSLDPSKKEQLIPAAAQGSLFEAAGKVALNTFSNLESLFGSAEENRPFDFQNAAAMQKMFGVSVGRGEAKRGDEKNFETSKQITGIVKKVFNDPEYSLKALDALKKQGAFSPEMQRKKSNEEVSNAINGFIPNFSKKIPEKIRAGRDFESAVFAKLQLGNPGNRTLDIPEGLLTGSRIQAAKASMGLQGSFGDVKLSDAKTNKYNFLGKLIKYFNLANYVTSAFKDKGQKEVSLNKKIPSINDATMFFSGNPSLYYPEEVSATLGQILHESRGLDGIQSPVLEAFKSARAKPGDPSSVALQDAFKRKRIVAKINMDGINPYQNTLDDKNPFAKGYIPNFSDGLLEKEIAKKSGSDLSLQDGVLKVGFLRSRGGNPLFEIARLINENKIKEIDAGGIIGPKIPDLIIGLKKMIERKRAKDPSFPRIKIKGFFRPKHLAEKISEQSEYKYKYKHGDSLKYYTKGYDYYGRKDQKNFVSAMNQMKLNRKDDSFVNLEKLYPQGFAQGYIPNFADPLKEAIGREMSAGVPVSQIYVDQNSSLKNSMNPMGLMVANRRDEPSGGMQGVNRARREGANPMTYGASRGFIPNYADNVDISEYVGKTRSSALLDESRKYGAELAKLTSEISQLTKQYSSLRNKNSTKGVALEAEIQALTENKNTLKQQSDATRKVITEQSKGVLGTGRTVLGKEAKVSPTNESSRDIIGKIFALQAGLSFLTAATEDAQNGFVKFGNALADSVSAATNVKFAFEGLSGFAPEGSKAAKVLGQLGTYGAIAAGAFEGFKQLASYLDSTNPSIKKTQSAMEGVADAASKASINLENLKPSEKASLKQRRTKFFEQEGISKGFMANLIDLTAASAAGGDVGNILGRVEFEGFGSASRENFTNIVDQASAVGISFKYLGEKLKVLKEDGVITGDEIRKFGFDIEELTKKIAGLSTEKVIKDLKLTQESGIGQALTQGTSEEFDKLLNQSRQKGDKGPLGPLQDFLFNAEMTDDAARSNFIKKLREDLLNYQKEETSSEVTRVQTASLSLLKQQLENRIAYKNALFEATSAEEYSLELQKEMLSVGEKERTAAGYKLQALQDAKKLTLEQEKATLDVLKNSELINKKLEGAGLGDVIQPEKFKEIAGISEEISDLIKQQGGYTQEVENRAQSLLTPIVKNKEQQDLIISLLKESNSEVEKRLALESKLNALSNLRTATLEAEKFVNEKRSAAITNEYNQQSKAKELAKRKLDIELEAFKIQKERQKIGGGAGGNLSIDRQIVEKEKYVLQAKFNIDKEDLLIQVRKTLAEAALSVGLSPTQVKGLNLNQVTTKEEAVAKAKEIDEIEKNIKINKLEAAQKEFEKTITSSNYFYDKIINSADIFLEKIAGKQVDVNQPSASITLQNGILTLAPTTVYPEDDLLKRGQAETNAQIQAIRNQESSSALADELGNQFDELGLSSDELVNQFGNLDNSLIQAGGSLTTFANLVRDVFTSLPETIAQNQFAMLTATDSQSIIGNAVEARRNAILAQGPASAGTIAQAADATAIYEKELEIKRAITAEDKINGEFELEKLKEILPLRMELLKAETNSEREAIIDRIIAKEKQRLPVLDRIKAAISSTAEQRTAELEDSLVNASVQFRDNLIDGVSKAIEEGGSLGDVLRSAALDFARTMTQAGLKNVTGQIGGLFGFAKGGLVPSMASGGMINGGSGSKDDVPAMLMGGEYVLKKTAVQKYGSDFLDALNNGRLGGYAKGGKVDELPNQTGAGGFFVPGLNGYGSIVGKENLLGFATQSYTSGAGDIMTTGENFASVNLEAESLRFTQFGRTNDRMSQATQSAKEEAFGLYGQQLQQELDYKKQLEEYEKQKKAEKKALRNQLLTMAITAAAGPLIGAAGAGFKAAFSAAGGMQNFLPAVGSGLKGIFTGGMVDGVNVGGLGNLFKGVGQGLTGNFAGAGNSFKLSQIGTSEQLQGAFNKSVASGSGFSGFLEKSGYIPKASIVNEGGVGINGGGGGGGIFDWARNLIFGKGSNKDGVGFEATGENISREEMAELMKDPVYRSIMNSPDPTTWTRRATGGTIPPTSGVDTVPTMLSGGEFIMNRAASQNIGAGNLQALNAGASSLPTEEKTEELNGKLIAKLDELIEATSGGGDITINVEAATGKASEEGGNSENEKRMQMARLIKDMVLKVIQDEKRLGGVLRR